MRFGKGFWSLALVFLLCLSLLPVGVLADEEAPGEAEESLAESQLDTAEEALPEEPAPAQDGEITASGDCGYTMTWTLADGVLTISGTGKMWSWYDCGEWANYKESITSVVIENGVTSIGSCAFRGCTSLESITIPPSVTSIKWGAFTNTPWLKNQGEFVIINGILVVYQGSDTNVAIPETVTSIGENVFAGCESLQSVTIPTSVTSIGEGAFYGCTSLESIVIPNSVTNISYIAFCECTGLEQVTIPASVTSMGCDVFLGCTNLKSITVLSSTCQMELNPYTSETGSNALGVPGTTTVYGYENSTAQTYAEEHSFDFSALTPAAPGDLDGNEIFDLTDVTMLLKLVTEQAEDTSSAADVNDDGVIDLKDVTRLFQFVSGQIDTL